MASSSTFSPNFFDINAWDLRDNDTIHDMTLFMRSFTHTVIRPNNGQDAPPKLASAFIELVADPRALSLVQIAIPELWSTEGMVLAGQNPWLWAMRSVTRPLGGEDTEHDAQTQAQRRTVNTAAVVLAVLNILHESVDLEMLPEIDAVKRAFATRLAGQMPR